MEIKTKPDKRRSRLPNPQPGVSVIRLEDLQNEEPKAAYAYWLAKRGKGPIPHFRDIDPTEIPKLLPYLTVVEVLETEPPDYYYRLEGEVVRTALGYNRAHKRLSELKAELGDRHQSMVRLYDGLCATKRVVAGRAVLTMLRRHFYEIEWIYLPFAGNHGYVERILICIGLLASPNSPSAPHSSA